MIIEINTTIGCQANLLSVKIIKSLITILLEDTFDSSGVFEEPILSEISILGGGHSVVEQLQAADEKESKRYIYIVTGTKSDACAIEQALLYWVHNPSQLESTMKQLNPEFNDPIWEGYSFERVAADIVDVIAALTLVLPGEVPPRCFRGNTSWIEQ